MPTFSALFKKKIQTEYESIMSYVEGPFELTEATALREANNRKLPELNTEINDATLIINTIAKITPLNTDIDVTDGSLKTLISKYELSLIPKEEDTLKKVDTALGKAKKKNDKKSEKEEEEDDLTTLENQREEIVKNIAKLKQEKADLEANLQKLTDAKKQRTTVSDELTALSHNCALKLKRNPGDTSVDRKHPNAYTKKTKKIKDILDKEKEDIDKLKADENRKARIKTIQDATIAALKVAPCDLKETDKLYKEIVKLHESRMRPFTDAGRSMGYQRLKEIKKQRNQRLQSQLNSGGMSIDGSTTDLITDEKVFIPVTEDQLQKAGEKLVFRENPDIEYTENGNSGHSLTVLTDDAATLQEAVALCRTIGCNTLELNPTENSDSVFARHKMAAEALREDFYHVVINAEKNDKKGRMLQHIFDIKRALAKRNVDRKKEVGLSQETDWAELYLKLGETQVVYHGTFNKKIVGSNKLQEMLIQTLRPEQVAQLIVGLHNHPNYKKELNKIAKMLMKRSVQEQNRYLLELNDHPDLQAHLLNRLAAFHQRELEKITLSTSTNPGTAFNKAPWYVHTASEDEIFKTMETLTAHMNPEIIEQSWGITDFNTTALGGGLAQKASLVTTKTYESLKKCSQMAGEANPISIAISGVASH